MVMKLMVMFLVIMVMVKPFQLSLLVSLISQLSASSPLSLASLSVCSTPSVQRCLTPILIVE